MPENSKASTYIIPFHCSNIPSLLDNMDDDAIIVQVLHEGVMWRGLSPLLNISHSSTTQYQQPVQKIKRRIIRKRRHLFYDYCIGRIAKKSSPTITSANQVIAILPPYFCSSPSTDYFEFTSRLLTWEHTLIRLQSLHAFTSTLGGGYFLCRQLHVATELARYQRRIAMALNDEHAAGVCTVVRKGR